MEKSLSALNIAVVGAGIAGIAASWYLSSEHRVTLFEKNDYIGGHTNTVEVVDSDGAVQKIDTGFIVCNRRNYPRFYELMAAWDVGMRDTEMSFGYCCEQSGMRYVGPGFSEFLRYPRSLLSPLFLALAIEQRKFNRRALRDLQLSQPMAETLGQYLIDIGCSASLVQHYLVPLSAAVWSSPERGILDFPLRTFLTFFRNHGMLELSKRPQWQTVVGGSHTYVKAFRKRFNGEVRSASGVSAVAREAGRVAVSTKFGTDYFDRVVLACHADEALTVLTDADEQERQALDAWRYTLNTVVLHSDATVLPRDRRNWASWNYYRRPGMHEHALSATYYMNRLQGLESRQDFFVTLNDPSIDASRIHYQTAYSHPFYTARSVASQQTLQQISGRGGVHFCGSYLGYGFHEDGVASALHVAKEIGPVV